MLDESNNTFYLLIYLKCSAIWGFPDVAGRLLARTEDHSALFSLSLKPSAIVLLLGGLGY